MLGGFNQRRKKFAQVRPRLIMDLLSLVPWLHKADHMKDGMSIPGVQGRGCDGLLVRARVR